MGRVTHDGGYTRSAEERRSDRVVGCVGVVIMLCAIALPFTVLFISPEAGIIPGGIMICTMLLTLGPLK